MIRPSARTIEFEALRARVAELETENARLRDGSGPGVFLWEEIELRGGGYHTFGISHTTEERDWGEPYRKSGTASYKYRIFKARVP